jgi:hypothetical protein
MGVYYFKCECWELEFLDCVGCLEMRCKEHETYTWASQRSQQWKNTNFHNTSTLVKALQYTDYLIKAGIKIGFHPRNFNSDGDFNLSWSWYPVTNIIKTY